MEHICDVFIEESLGLKYSLNCKLEMYNWVLVDETQDQRCMCINAHLWSWVSSTKGLCCGDRALGVEEMDSLWIAEKDWLVGSRETRKSCVIVPRPAMGRDEFRHLAHLIPDLLTPWSWTSQTPELWEINVSHPVMVFCFSESSWLRHLSTKNLQQTSYLWMLFF